MRESQVKDKLLIWLAWKGESDLVGERDKCRKYAERERFALF